jgi:hypothetical protein
MDPTSGRRNSNRKSGVYTKFLIDVETGCFENSGRQGGRMGEEATYTMNSFLCCIRGSHLGDCKVTASSEIHT